MKTVRYSCYAISLAPSPKLDSWWVRPIVGAPWELIYSKNLACFILARYIGRWFNNTRRQVETIVWKKPGCNFAFIYLSGFFPLYGIWTSMGPLFGEVEGGGGLLSLFNVSRSALFRFPSRPSFLFLNLCSLYLSHMNLYLPVLQISLDLIFSTAGTGCHFGNSTPPLKKPMKHEAIKFRFTHCSVKLPHTLPPPLPDVPATTHIPKHCIHCRNQGQE